MTITIDCSCGAQFNVDLDPAAVPVTDPVPCPKCGADLAESLNAAATPAEEPPPPAAPAPPPAPAAALPTHCAQHPDQPLEIFCFVCKKPMCTQCMEKHGFVCSAYCRQKARDQGMIIPAYEREQSVVRRKQRAKGRVVSVAISAVGLALLAAWAWWALIGTKPQPVFRLDLAGHGLAARVQFLGADQVLLEGPRYLAVYEARDGTKLWASDAPGLEGGQLLQATATDLWLLLPHAVLRLDRQTGRQAALIPLAGAILQHELGDTSLLVVAAGPTNTQRQLTRIRLPDGQATSLTATILVPPPRQFNSEELAAAAEDGAPTLVTARTEFLVTGPNVLQADITLLATNIVAVKALKPRVDRADNDMSVANSLAIAEDLLNEMKQLKTGGVRRDDQSRYRVTLRRLFAPGPCDWTGEVTGPPAVFSLPSVELLVAGTELRAFDKSNQLLWQANLSSPIAGGFTAAERAAAGPLPLAPAVERAGVLYFCDQGVLTAFDLKTGNVRWRLASVGIARLEFDDNGMLYLSSTSAAVDSIQYSQQQNVRDPVKPVILKVNPATGQVLWRAENQGDRFILAGRFLYFTKTQVSGLEALAAASKGGEVPLHFRIYRADPSSGKVLWEYYRNQGPVDLAFRQNQFVLLFPDRLELLRFRGR